MTVIVAYCKHDWPVAAYLECAACAHDIEDIKTLYRTERMEQPFTMKGACQYCQPDEDRSFLIEGAAPRITEVK